MTLIMVMNFGAMNIKLFRRKLMEDGFSDFR